MNRKIIGGIVFLLIFVGIAGVFLLTRQNTDTEPNVVFEPPPPEVIQQIKADIAERNAIGTQQADKSSPPSETSETRREPSEPHDAPASVTENVPVSPHGFGPYPPLPKEWQEAVKRRGEPFLWKSMSRDVELMIRVRIKLMNQGVPVKGVIMDKGLVYPIIKGVRYVEWEWSGFPPRRYITTSIGTIDDGKRLRSIKAEIGRELTAGDVPSDIELKPLSKAGIDPYTFLDLP